MLFTNTNLRTAMAYTNAVGDKVYPVIVDIKKGIKSTEEILFVSSDINTGILSVAFIQGNDTYNVAGAEVVCSIMRPDASTLDIPCTVIENNIVEVPLGVNGTSQDGIYSFDFKIFKGGNKVVGTPTMNYSVSLSISNDNAVLEDDRLPVLTMLMTQLTELKEETRETINQANTATEATKVATANAIEATNNVNAVINTANQKMVEVDNAKNEMTATVTNKVNEVEGRFNALTASQQQSSEVIDARDGETSLKARLDRDIEKAKQVYVNVEGSHISTDSSVGYAKDVEILGNTVQNASNLADIRSVGDKVEGQELYEIPVVTRGKNLFNPNSPLVDMGSPSYNNAREILVRGNTYYAYTSTPYVGAITVNFYKSDDTYISGIAISSGQNFLTPTECKKVRMHTDINSKIQLEEGTVATPYEPYQEDKLTILSPVQLEKVGDVADRIICKDGVWGVEKNVFDYTITGSENFILHQSVPNTTDMIYVGFKVANIYNVNNKICIMSSAFQGVSTDYNWSSIVEGVSSSGEYINFRVLKAKASTIDEFKVIIKNTQLKLLSKIPQFIPLPHDQQVKLRTFASKTNISFGCEIEGTIKAQVPKSLGATVNTHTTQISNLNKELDRVKKLEESTVSTVTTESDFTIVEATSNGYFEDVKLEGKTLVNLWDIHHLNVGGQAVIKNERINVTTTDNMFSDFICVDKSKFKPSTEYTIIVDVYKNTLQSKDCIYITSNSGALSDSKDIFAGNGGTQFIIDGGVVGRVVRKYTTISDFSKADYVLRSFVFNVSQTAGKEIELVITVLEGDHTQNPPSYFEGLKSVGDTTDEIVVSSTNSVLEGITFDKEDADGYVLSINPIHFGKFYVYTPFDKYIILCVVNNNGNWIRDIRVEGMSCTEVNLNDNEYIKFIIFRKPSWQSSYDYVSLAKQIIINENPVKQDKKRLLYYNEETQVWEKPVLREWDSVEKHSDGKYYYHQGSAEVVLNGSENEQWAKNGVLSTDTYTVMHLQNQQIKPTNSMEDFICDKLIPANYNNASSECISKYSDGTQIVIKVSTSKLSTQDVAGFKQWLQANNVTVVYQLAQEKVYECTNIDLLTFANETNYIVESGAIAPKSILKVHNNISNVVKILQEKVSLLENKFIEGLKKVLAGDMYSLAELLYPEDFEEVETENSIMLLPLE